jgi:hypothetical protein
MKYPTLRESPDVPDVPDVPDECGRLDPDFGVCITAKHDALRLDLAHVVLKERSTYRPTE